VKDLPQDRQGNIGDGFSCGVLPESVRSDFIEGMQDLKG
jgi:hypothetical protein